MPVNQSQFLANNPRFRPNPPASDEEVAVLVQLFNGSVPQEYRYFLQHISNGGIGFLGNLHTILWRASEVPRWNLKYDVRTFAPELLLFGSDGGGQAFAFDLRDSERTIVEVPFIPLDTEEAQTIGSTFDDFLEWCSNQNA